MRLAGQSAEEESVLRLAPGCDPAALALTPAEGFLLSRIDGRTSRGVLRTIGALAPAEIDRCLERWLKSGVLERVRPSAGPEPRLAAPPPPVKPAPPPAKPAPRPAGLALPPEDASLDLAVELQRELLEFEGRLERPYHEILGVARDADERASRGPTSRSRSAASGPLLPPPASAPLRRWSRPASSKLLEAYELLSDPQTRAEVQATQASAPADPAPARRSSLEARRRLRERVGALAGAKRASEDRRRKAKSFFEAGMAAFANERWLEAAGSVRLAIAFDPENEVFRERFAEVQRRAHEERARALLKQAEARSSCATSRRRCVCSRRPCTIARRIPSSRCADARVACKCSASCARRRSSPRTRCELAPENGAYRRTLGLVYSDAGLDANARRELEAALRCDPSDAEAKAALRGL